MVNYDTNCVVIPYYPPNAGGKFLINCLALSPRAEFQHWQLIGKMSSTEERFVFLKKLIESNEYFWSDLGMGCQTLLRVDKQKAINSSTVDEKKEIFNNSSTLKYLSNRENLFFIIAHNRNSLNSLLEVWNNARVIKFNNAEKFIEFRGFNNWTHPASGDPDVFKKELEITCPVIHFDVNSYFEEDFFLTEIEKIYQQLKLSFVNPEYIRLIYRSWFNVIQKIKYNTNVQS